MCTLLLPICWKSSPVYTNVDKRTPPCGARGTFEGKTGILVPSPWTGIATTTATGREISGCKFLTPSLGRSERRDRRLAAVV